MDNRRLVAISLSMLIVVSAAIFYLMPGEESFEKFRSNADQSSYQINYSADFNETFVGEDYNYSYFEVYSHKEQYKNILRFNKNGQEYRNVSFIAGNDSLVCENIQKSTINPEKCSIKNSETKFFYELLDAAPDYRARINSTENISGHTCSQFRFTTRKKFVPNGENLEYSPEVSICLDNEEGYVASMDIKGYIDQGNSTQKISVVEIKAEEINRDFDSKVEPKFELITNTHCDSSNTELKVLSFGEIGEITVKVNNKNETFDLTPYKKSEIYIPRNLLDNGSNEIEIYTEKSRRSLECNYIPK